MGKTKLPPPEPGKADPVNPAHYRLLGEYSAIHVAEKWHANPHVTHALKYIQRAGTKKDASEEQDLSKAVWYLLRRLHLINPDKFPDPASGTYRIVVDG